MYVPEFNRMDDGAVRGFVRARAAGEFVTVGPDGLPDASFLPFLWEGDTVFAHLAKANPQVRRIVEGSSALVVVSGADAYVSPSWYASKAEHGEVVPTWSYSAVHLRGRVVLRHDVEWLRGMVTRLTERHELSREQPWAVEDAPDRFLLRQLRAIVGVEIAIESVEAKAKLSQNRSAADLAGVVEGLSGEPGPGPAGVRAEMAREAPQPEY